MAEFTFEVKKHFGMIEPRDADEPEQYCKELNLISWNEAEPKYDIRAWNTDHTRMSKGITLTRGDLENLYKIIGTALV